MLTQDTTVEQVKKYGIVNMPKIIIMLDHTIWHDNDVNLFFTSMQGQAPHKTLNALDLMIKLESETTSGSTSMQQLEPLLEGNSDDQTLTVSDPHDRGASPSRQKHNSRDATTPTRRKPRGRAQSTSMLTSGAGSGNCKNHSITSVGNGKLHSSHTSGHSSHNSQHPSNSGGGSEGKAVRTRTVSVGSKPMSSASQRRPSSGGHTSHREKRHSTSSHNS